YRRVSFVKRDGAVQAAGIAHTRSKEDIPIRIAYRIRFIIGTSRLPDARRIVIEGWDVWFNARVAEAVRAFSEKIPVEDLIAPTSRYSDVRERLRQSVVAHLAQTGIEVSAFQIESLTVDREALLAYKRQDLRRRARAPVGRVAVFGIDGADWDLLDDLIDGGRMPNLASMVRGGASAQMESIQPLVTPLVWASLSTGLPPSRHGIVDFFERGPQGNPVNSRSRNAPAIWEISAAFGRATVVNDWWTAWPPLRDEAIIVAPGDERIPLPENLDELRVRRQTIGYPQISRFAEVSQSELSTALSTGGDQEPLAILRDVLAQTWSDHRVGLALYQQEQPMLFMLGFPATDVVHHVFGPFHPPNRSAVDNDLRSRYWPVVINYYIELDRLLGEWMQVLSEDTTVLVVSAYGHQWGGGRPTTLPFDRSDLSSHRARGVFIAYGNRVDPSRVMRSIDLLDFAPTVLSLLGLPKAEEMPGETASAFFTELEPVQSVDITSYSDVVVLRRRGAVPDPDRYRARLAMVGHVPAQANEAPSSSEPPPTGGPEWGRYAWLNNEGVRLAREGNLQNAMDSFEEAIGVKEDRVAPYLNLARIALKSQRYSSAEALVWKAIDTGAENPESIILDLAAWYRANDMPSRAIALLEEARVRYPDSFAIVSNLGSALAAADRYTDAINVLEDALGLRPTSNEVLNNLGIIYAQQEDYGRALDYWNRSLEITPRQPKIAEAVRAAVSRL
ncbi:MAG: alkaline phosphatase family protein, partial [Acidobacteria bacterium]|nr:alkaline phosphatase family protein [Acidobacteriota bacterium]